MKPLYLKSYVMDTSVTELRQLKAYYQYCCMAYIEGLGASR